MPEPTSTEPAYELLSRDKRLIEDLSTYLTCYRQERDGWYKPSCYEAGHSVRRCCVTCRVLKRLDARLRSLARREARDG